MHVKYFSIMLRHNNDVTILINVKYVFIEIFKKFFRILSQHDYFYSPSIFVAFVHVVDISPELIQIGLLFHSISKLRSNVLK